MAFKMNRPAKMKGPIKRSTMFTIGSKRNQLNSGMYYNSKMEGSPMSYSSAFKQDETTLSPEEIQALEKETTPENTGGDKNPGLLPSENPDTYVYQGDDIHEKINDLEDRIEFINEDVWNQDDVPTDQQTEDLEILNTELEELYEELKTDNKEGNIKPGYDEEGNRNPDLDEEY